MTWNDLIEFAMPETSKFIKIKLQALCQDNQEFGQFLSDIQSLGKVAVVGGILRDWILHQEYRDIDLTIDCDTDKLTRLIHESYWEHEDNYFGGHKLSFGKLKVDIWAFNKTWAFQHQTCQPTFSNWLGTTFFNIDSIVYLVQDEQIIENGFLKAFGSKTLDVVFQDNPAPTLCVLKSILHKKKYGLEYSPTLTQYLTNWVGEPDSMKLKRLEGTYKIVFKQAFPKELLSFLPGNLGEKLLQAPEKPRAKRPPKLSSDELPPF